MRLTRYFPNRCSSDTFEIGSKNCGLIALKFAQAELCTTNGVEMRAFLVSPKNVPSAAIIFLSFPSNTTKRTILAARSITYLETTSYWH